MMTTQTIKKYPPLGQITLVTLANGTTLDGYWDGLQWWVGVQDEANDVPIANAFVVDWAEIPA